MSRMCEEGHRWQDRLHSHFSALHPRRTAGRALFALEHDLDQVEIGAVRQVISEGVSSPKERSSHWLLWVVHATEVAYAYAGDEYWQSFERQTPGWDNGVRPWIRTIFQDFNRQYGGPRPTGSWSDWFTIISWPITNAVLPADLQRHLARALYLARDGLAARLSSLEELGRYVAASGWEGSDRFAQLKEQPLLLGQIALALLRPRELTDALLLPTSLQRIAHDLEAERSAASWLRGARGTVERTSIRLSGVRRVGEVAPSEPFEEQVRSAARLASPRLALRVDRSGSGLWNAILRLPNLSPIAAVSPGVREALLTSRCWAPAADRPIARAARPFSGPRRRARERASR